MLRWLKWYFIQGSWINRYKVLMSKLLPHYHILMVLFDCVILKRLIGPLKIQNVDSCDYILFFFFFCKSTEYLIWGKWSEGMWFSVNSNAIASFCATASIFPFTTSGSYLLKLYLKKPQLDRDVRINTLHIFYS